MAPGGSSHGRLRATGALRPAARGRRHTTEAADVRPEERPPSPAELARRIHALLAAPAGNLALPPDLMRLYRSHSRQLHSGMIAAWCAMIGWLNIPEGLLELGIYQHRALPFVLGGRALLAAMFLCSALLIKTGRAIRFAGALLVGPTLCSLLFAGAAGLLSGSATLFCNDLMMGMVIVYTGVMFLTIDLAPTILIALPSGAIMSALIIASPLQNPAERLALVVFYASVLGGLVLGRSAKNRNLHRMFLMKLKDDAENSEITRHNQQLSSIAYTDRLTDIPNRRYFDEIAETIDAAPESSLPLAICLFDIDHFKSLNDQLGHVQGDRCLRVIAATIRNNLRSKSDILARYGGEEFVLVLPNTDDARAVEIIERIRLAVLGLNHPNPGTELERVTVSAGVALSYEVQDVSQLLENADKALYRAKMCGRNQLSW
jgi:diguanylate cyclase (GGDEF)-like protein